MTSAYADVTLDLEDCEVEFELQRAEPDVGIMNDGVLVYSVTYNKLLNLLPILTDAQVADIAGQIAEQIEDARLEAQEARQEPR